MFSSMLNTPMILMYLTRMMVVFLITPLHEFAHAWTAHKMGDNTAKDMGRLTIDPMAHMDGLGALLIMVCGFGWAKPVPVKPTNFKHPSFGMMVTAVAGPCVNLLAAFAGVIVLQLCDAGDYLYFGSGMIYDGAASMEYLMWMISQFVSINLMLCLFNMIPVPPLDGSRVLTFLLPPRAAVWVMRNQRFFYGAVMVLMVTGLLGFPLKVLEIYISEFMLQITSWIPAVTSI